MNGEFVKIAVENEIKNFFINSISDIKDNLFDKNIIYPNKFITNENYLNFTNYSFGNYFDTTIRNLIVGEVWKLEEYSFGLGNLLLEYLIEYFDTYPYDIFNNPSLDNNLRYYLDKKINLFESEVKFLNKKDLNDYIEKVNSKKVKEIGKIILEHADIDDSIFIEESFRSYDVVKKTNKINFKVKFDDQFVKSTWYQKDYRYIIIDGFVDSLGEIHHLLHKASEDKEPYVVFCKGMHEEVKQTILYNNKRGTINVMPICLVINEENVNILNDIASCHGSEIVSSTKGDTISSSVKRDLPYGKSIIVTKQGFSLKCMDEKSKYYQLNYLNKKLLSLNRNDPNYTYINKRIKNLNAKKMTISLSKDTTNLEKRTLKGLINFINHCRDGIILLKNNNKSQRKIYAKKEIIILFKKLESIIKTLKNLGCVIYKET